MGNPDPLNDSDLPISGKMRLHHITIGAGLLCAFVFASGKCHEDGVQVGMQIQRCKDVGGEFTQTGLRDNKGNPTGEYHCVKITPAVIVELDAGL